MKNKEHVNSFWRTPSEIARLVAKEAGTLRTIDLGCGYQDLGQYCSNVLFGVEMNTVFTERHYPIKYGNALAQVVPFGNAPSKWGTAECVITNPPFEGTLVNDFLEAALRIAPKVILVAPFNKKRNHALLKDYYFDASFQRDFNVQIPIGVFIYERDNRPTVTLPSCYPQEAALIPFYRTTESFTGLIFNTSLPSTSHGVRIQRGRDRWWVERCYNKKEWDSLADRRWHPRNCRGNKKGDARTTTMALPVSPDYIDEAYNSYIRAENNVAKWASLNTPIPSLAWVEALRNPNEDLSKLWEAVKGSHCCFADFFDNKFLEAPNVDLKNSVKEILNGK